MSTLSAMFKLQDAYSSQIEKLTLGTDKAIVAIEKASGLADKLEKVLADVGAESKTTGRKVDDLGNEVDDLGKQADNTTGMVNKLLSSLLSIAAIKSLFSFGLESFDLSNQQKSVERQLKVVLANVGAADDAFDRLADKASEVQSKTIYGDEAMISGAAEISTYISDTDAVEHMMDTLANYAAGMSGGGEVDTKGMTDYATQLGKALDGTYDGLTKKGFELTDEQKKIIENGTDMEKALVLDDVINQSWAGLAESMADLPENKIISIKNVIGDLREEVGNRITPGIMYLYSMIEKYMPQIESMMLGIGNVMNVIIFLIGGIIDAAGAVVAFFVDNWSWIAPIILGIAAALLTYAAYQGISKAATLAFTIAQNIMNASMLASPIVWIVGILVALVAAIYYAVEAYNEWAGTSETALGIICGGLAVAGAFIWNLIVGVVNAVIGIGIELWNLVATFANFFANVFNDPVGAIINLFSGMFDFILGIVQAAAKLIDTVLKTDMTGAIEGFRNTVAEQTAEIVGDSQIEVMEKLNASDYQFDGINYTDAWNSGKAFGDSASDSLSNMLSGYGGTDDWDSVGTDSNPATVEGTGAGGTVEVNMADEDIQYLRDLAERDYVTKIASNTLAPNIHVEFSGPISKTADTDQIIGVVEGYLTDEIAACAEG